MIHQTLQVCLLYFQYAKGGSFGLLPFQVQQLLLPQNHSGVEFSDYPRQCFQNLDSLIVKT